MFHVVCVLHAYITSICPGNSSLNDNSDDVFLGRAPRTAASLKAAPTARAVREATQQEWRTPPTNPPRSQVSCSRRSTLTSPRSGLPRDHHTTTPSERQHTTTDKQALLSSLSVYPLRLLSVFLDTCYPFQTVC